MAGKNDSVISDLLSGFQSSGGKGRAKTSQDSHDHSAHATKQATASSGGAAGQPNARPGFEVPDEDEPRRAGSGNREPSLNPIQDDTGARSESSGVSQDRGGSSSQHSSTGRSENAGSVETVMDRGGSGISHDGASHSAAGAASRHSSTGHSETAGSMKTAMDRGGSSISHDGVSHSAAGTSSNHSSTGHSETAGSMKTAMDRGGSSISHDGASVSSAATSSHHSSTGQHSATTGSSKDTSSSHSAMSAHGAGGGGASAHEGHSTSSGSSTHSSGNSLSRQENSGRSIVSSSSEGNSEAGTRYRTTERDDGSVTKEREAYRVEGDFTYTHKEAVSRNAAGEEFSTVTDTTYNATTGERSSKIIATSAEGESRLSVSETISANDKGGVLHRTIERDDGSITKEREAFAVDGNVAKTHTESHTRNADGSELVSITKSEREVAERAPSGVEQGGALMVSERSSSISSHSIEEIAPHLAPASHFEPQAAAHGAESKSQAHEQGTAHAVTSGQSHDKSEVAANHTQAQGATSAETKSAMLEAGSEHGETSSSTKSSNAIDAVISVGATRAESSQTTSQRLSDALADRGQSSGNSAIDMAQSTSFDKTMSAAAGQSHDQSVSRSGGTPSAEMSSTQSAGSSRSVDQAAGQSHGTSSAAQMSSAESAGSTNSTGHAQSTDQAASRSHGTSAADMTQSSRSSQSMGARAADMRTLESAGSKHDVASPSAPSSGNSREVQSVQPESARGESSPALEKAIEQHIEKHGLSQDGTHAKEMATGFAAAALSQISELKSNGGDLSQSELNVATGVVQPWMSSGPHGVSLDTLDVIAQKGLSPEGLHELTTALGGEAAGLSNLQLAERVGPDVIEQMGEKGFPAEKLAAVQELAASLGDAVGVKDVSLTKLEGLDVLKEINAPNNADSILFAEAKPNGEVSMGTMSKDDFSKNPEMAGATVNDINDALAGLDRNQAQERAAAAESKREQPEMSMSMSMAA